MEIPTWEITKPSCHRQWGTEASFLQPRECPISEGDSPALIRPSDNYSQGWLLDYNFMSQNHSAKLMPDSCLSETGRGDKCLLFLPAEFQGSFIHTNR